MSTRLSEFRIIRLFYQKIFRSVISLNIFRKFFLYWETLRRLKPVQFYWRGWFKLYRPRINALANAQSLRVPGGEWRRPAARGASMLGPTQFRFLNQTYSMSTQDGWNDVALEKLWLYNLHYFDDLNAHGATERYEWHCVLIKRWLAQNLPTSGNGWEPYPTSLRIVNWVKWLATGNPAVPGMLVSLSLQAAWLSRRLERHLLGNHLFVNAKALVFAGLCFEGPQAASWLATGLKIITQELPEQVLVDGGNFERSPMYHAIFLEDVLDLINAANCWSGIVSDVYVASWRETAGRMLDWLAAMTHPDGEIALFNDAAFGVAPSVAELMAYAGRLGVTNSNQDREPCRADFITPWSTEVEVTKSNNEHGLLHLSASGYVRMQKQDAVSLLDVAPIGPDYLPGHAHADTLSFELSVFGQRVVVNGGTSRYGVGLERLRERGTAAHSTVEVAGQNSSEVWGGFRVARRAYPFDLQLQDDAGTLKVACSHDGYKRLSGAPMHRREWVMYADSLEVADTVSGGDHTAVARYILHPDVKVTAADNNKWQLTLAGEQILCVLVLEGQGCILPASYAPEFGIVLPTKCLAVFLTQGQARVKWIWS
jgi:uncharacterized heparinase superfamily protein